MSCKYCGVGVNLKTLTVHLRTHPEANIYQCGNCEKYFSSQIGLQKHWKRKHGEQCNETTDPVIHSFDHTCGAIVE